MNTDIAIRSTAKNWIVSIRRTSMHGIVTTVPVATIPRRAYAAATLAGAVTATQKMFMADNVVIDTDRDGVYMLISLGIVRDAAVEAQISAFDAKRAQQEAACEISIREGV